MATLRSSATPQPPASSRRQDRFWFWFDFVTLLVGVGGVLFFFVRPMLATHDRGGWVKTVCSIESSRLKTPSGGTNTAYAVEVLYRYRYGGRDHQFRHSHSLGESAGERQARRAVNRRFAPGRTTVCYVNPRNPVEAVLARPGSGGASTSADWIGLSPLVLVAAALFGLFGRRARSRPSPAAPAPVRQGRSLQLPRALSKDATPSEDALEPQELGEESLEFRPARAPWQRAVIVMLVALVFNGAVAAFVLAVAAGLPDGKHAQEMLPAILCLAVASVVGLMLLGFAGYFFLALFNPRPWFQVNTRTLAPGATLAVEWKILGRTERLQRLKFFLEAIEAAKWGSDPEETERQFLDRVTVFETTDADQIRAGRASLVIPAQLIPSFASEHNRIDWSLRVCGEIPRWPDLQEEMPVVLLPVAPGSTISPAATPNLSSTA